MFLHLRRSLLFLNNNKISTVRQLTRLPTQEQRCTLVTEVHDGIGKVRDEGSRMKLHVSGWPHALRLSYIWLRDHCHCHSCYNHDTQQRKYDVNTIPLTVHPLAVSPSSSGLKIEWPDGHVSEYCYNFLWQNSFEGQKSSRKYPQELWTQKSFPEISLISTPLSSVKGQGAGLKKLVESVVKYGVGIITEVPANIDATRETIEEVATIKSTFFGDMWSFTSDKLEHADTAYTNEFLGAHTDNTYFSQASRIQVFHCLQQAVEGGDTLLVDGFAIAEQFQQTHPEGYDFLSKMAFPSHYLEEGQHHRSLDFIFKHHPQDKRLKQFRYNIYDRAPLSSIPSDSMHEFYLHLRNLTKIVRKKKNEYWINLQPGKILFIDNWRVMHGRASYKGPRIMGGCYLDQDGFSSKARLLGIEVD